MIKKILIAPARFIEAFLDRAIAFAGGLIFMQVPSFMVQYTQRLGGHLEELGLIIKKYKLAAEESGKSLNEYISLHLNSGVKEFISSGKLMEENLERFDYLNQAYNSLHNSSGINKLLTFIKNIDITIAKETWKDFTASISLSYESIIYCLAGIVFFMTIYLLVKKLIIFSVKHIKRR